MFESLHVTLGKDLAALQRGDFSVVSQTVAALERVTESDTAALPSLRGMLAIENGDIQVFSAVALGRMKMAASDAVPDLAALMDRKTGAGSLAAASSLGNIRTPESVKALVAALDNMDRSSAGHILPSLARMGELAKPALPKLEKMWRGRGNLTADIIYEVAEAMKSIRRADREQHASELANASITDFVPLYSQASSPTEGEEPSFAGTGTDIDNHPTIRFSRFMHENIEQEGMIANCRLRFLAQADMPSECGLRVYRNVSGHDVVIVSADSRSAGTSITNAAEGLATAITAIYALDPARLVWFERYDMSRATSPERGEEISKVNFTWDEASSTFSDPQWHRVGPIRAELQKLGIEW